MTQRESNQLPSELKQTASSKEPHQLEWSVEVALHGHSIFAHVGEQRSFHVSVTCTGAKKYRTDVWWAEWVGYSGDLNSYREIIGGGLQTREGMLHR